MCFQWVPRHVNGSTYQLPKLLSQSLVIFFWLVNKVDVAFAKLVWRGCEPFPRAHALAGWKLWWIITNGIFNRHSRSRASIRGGRESVVVVTSDHNTVSITSTIVMGRDLLKELDGHYDDLI